MSQFSFESETVEETQTEQLQAEQPEEQPQEQAEERAPEKAEEASQEPVAEAETLALSVDDFAALEDRIVRAVELVKRERLTRAAAEERAAKAEAQLNEQTPQMEQLQKDVTVLNAERDQVRQRVERLLSQLDALEL